MLAQSLETISLFRMDMSSSSFMESKRFRLLQDQRGTAIIEFAIVAAPFIALLLAVMQTTLTMFTQQVLETAVEKNGRTIRVGQVQADGISQSAFKTQLCKTLRKYVDCADVMIDIRTANSMADVDSSTLALTYDGSNNVTNSWKYLTGGPGDIVIMRLMYQMPAIGGPLGFTLANMKNGRRLLVATSVFKNESY